MEINKSVFVLQEWVSYGAEKKMESANNVILQDYV